MADDVNLKALFIGDKAENGDFYIEKMDELLRTHMGWREMYMPGDKPDISEADKREDSFIATKDRVIDVLDQVKQKMLNGAIPWASAGRYWGQMNSDTLLPSMLAYCYAMLWNSNNVALESSMATSQMESEVGDDFCALLGFPEGWGHLTHDGSMANLEGIWYARCIKSIPLAVAEVLPDKVAGKSEWELLNMSVDEVLDLCASLTPDELDQVKARSSRSGKNIQKLGKWILPQTKHYSWLKSLDISGVGLDAMVEIPVKTNYRMDVDKLNETIAKLVEEKTPILGVVAVVGTTEEGAVDEVDKIADIRDEWSKKGVNFFLHIDAAYGGYGRALILDTDGSVIPYDQLDAKLKEHNVFNYPVTISKDVYEGYKAIGRADAVTIDPHKMGYVPYSAGGIAIRKENMRNLISYFAPYVFEKRTQALPDLLGAYILGGSKAGATAAAVWAAHRVVPLNISGYGRLVGASMECANRFRHFLGDLSFDINGKKVHTFTLNNPDFNMVDWVFKVEGCDSLAETNALNEKLFDLSSYLDGPVYNLQFITSHTTFAKDGYGDSPLPFVEGMGFDKSEWDKVGQVTLLRAAIMTPYLQSEEMFDFYTSRIKDAIQKRLEEALG